MPPPTPVTSAKNENVTSVCCRLAAAKRGGESPSYDDWTKDELYERAQELDIEGRSDLSKDELIDALRNH